MMNKIAMVLLCLAVASAANAKYVEVQFEGEITVINGTWFSENLNDSISLESRFSGVFSYDTQFQEVTPGDPLASGFLASTDVYEFSISVGDYSISAVENYWLSILNNETRGDVFSASCYALNVSGPQAEPVDWKMEAVEFEDSTGDALISDQLPANFPALEEWTSVARIILSPLPGQVINGQITNLTVVPEPASLALLALGGLAVVRRR